MPPAGRGRCPCTLLKGFALKNPVFPAVSLFFLNLFENKKAPRILKRTKLLRGTTFIYDQYQPTADINRLFTL